MLSVLTGTGLLAHSKADGWQLSSLDSQLATRKCSGKFHSSGNFIFDFAHIVLGFMLEKCAPNFGRNTFLACSRDKCWDGKLLARFCSGSAGSGFPACPEGLPARFGRQGRAVSCPSA